MFDYSCEGLGWDKLGFRSALFIRAENKALLIIVAQGSAFFIVKTSRFPPKMSCEPYSPAPNLEVLKFNLRLF
jgi:hypothetical protein